MWVGTPEEFYELYCVSARHLKSTFPHLKIGGCGCDALELQLDVAENTVVYIGTIIDDTGKNDK